MFEEKPFRQYLNFGIICCCQGLFHIPFIEKICRKNNALGNKKIEKSNVLFFASKIDNNNKIKSRYSTVYNVEIIDKSQNV